MVHRVLGSRPPPPPNPYTKVWAVCGVRLPAQADVKGAPGYPQRLCPDASACATTAPPTTAAGRGRAPPPPPPLTVSRRRLTVGLPIGGLEHAAREASSAADRRAGRWAPQDPWAIHVKPGVLIGVLIPPALRRVLVASPRTVQPPPPPQRPPMSTEGSIDTFTQLTLIRSYPPPPNGSPNRHTRSAMPPFSPLPPTTR